MHPYMSLILRMLRVEAALQIMVLLLNSDGSVYMTHPHNLLFLLSIGFELRPQ